MLSPRFDEAFAFAAEAHRTQIRKGTDIPYLAHLMSVAALVIEHGGDEEQAIAALLHDAVEDQGGSGMAASIAERFGARVARIVRECSDSSGDPKPAWQLRKRAYVAGVARKSPDAVLVTAADKLHNARAILADYREVGEDLWDRFSADRAGVLWYYRALADALSARAPGPLTAELCRTVSQLEALTAR